MMSSHALVAGSTPYVVIASVSEAISVCSRRHTSRLPRVLLSTVGQTFLSVSSFLLIPRGLHNDARDERAKKKNEPSRGLQLPTRPVSSNIRGTYPLASAKRRVFGGRYSSSSSTGPASN